jgi:L-ascorbate metabolism protein UlaG (beta-lactamase superfamily)
MGLRLLTDPNPLYPIPVAPEVVTISNLHDTHTGVGSIPGQPQLLWGLTPEGAWNQIATTIRDVALFNVPSYASRIEPEQSPVQNSIFIFRMGRLCIAHLGNLRHPLTPRQLQYIGKPDVVMVPADGQWTLSAADVVTVIEQLQPRLVLPMHIDVPFQAEMFARSTGGRYPVRRVPERHLTLSPSLLPTATEIVLLGSP